MSIVNDLLRQINNIIYNVSPLVVEPDRLALHLDPKGKDFVGWLEALDKLKEIFEEKQRIGEGEGGLIDDIREMRQEIWKLGVRTKIDQAQEEEQNADFMKEVVGLKEGEKKVMCDVQTFRSLKTLLEYIKNNLT